LSCSLIGVGAIYSYPFVTTTEKYKYYNVNKMGNMAKPEPYVFIAQMDSMGRLRIPAIGREAKGYEPGMRFNVTIVELEE
jgi:hypothetical protein